MRVSGGSVPAVGAQGWDVKKLSRTGAFLPSRKTSFCRKENYPQVILTAQSSVPAKGNHVQERVDRRECAREDLHLHRGKRTDLFKAGWSLKGMQAKIQLPVPTRAEIKSLARKEGSPIHSSSLEKGSHAFN